MAFHRRASRAGVVMSSVLVFCFASAGFVQLPGNASQPRAAPVVSTETKPFTSQEEYNFFTVGTSWASAAVAAMLLGFVTGASPAFAEAKGDAELAAIKQKALEAAVRNAQQIAADREAQVAQLDKAETLLKKLESNKGVEFTVKADNLKKQELVREKIMEDLDKKAAKVEGAKTAKPVEAPKIASPAPAPAPAKVASAPTAAVALPKFEAPKEKVEASKAEPKETPKVEAPKAETPKVEVQATDEDIPKAQAFFRQFFQKQKAKDAEIIKKQKEEFQQADQMRTKVIEDLEKRRLEAKKAAEEAEAIATRLEELAKNAREAATQAKALAGSAS